MMEFSNYLREQLQKKEITIASFARQTGIERTTLSKVLSGQRLLPYDALDAVVLRLRLTPLEEKTLRYFYEIQFEQKGISESREIIDKMFLDLANLEFSINTLEERKLLIDVDDYTRNRSVVSGNLNVSMLLRLVLSVELSQKDSRIEMTVPPKLDFINQELLQRYLAENIDAEITQIIAFDSCQETTMGNLNNLKGFCQVLPLCLLSRQKYHPYYFYDEYIQKQYMDPFPYFLVTQKHVVCLSENGEEAMVLRSKEQISHYHKHFKKLLDKCRSLISYTVNPAEVLRLYAERTDSDGYYTIMDQPCFGRYYEDAFIEEHIHQEIPHREYLTEIAQKRFKALRDAKDFYTLFTKNGLQRFMDTGVLDDFPEVLVRPFSMEVRKKLMNKMANDTLSGENTARILDSGIFPNYLSLTTSVNSGIGFFLTEQSPVKGDFFSIHLEEPSVRNAFHRWLLGLAESRCTLDAKDTAKVILEMLKN